MFWELFEKGKKKDELVVKHYAKGAGTPSTLLLLTDLDHALLNTNFNLIHYDFNEQSHTLMVGTLTTYKKVCSTLFDLVLVLS